MNDELYGFICNAKINESLYSVTHIILKHQENSYKEIQETFINILAYICSFLTIYDTFLLNEVVLDIHNFIESDNVIIKDVYVLICKLCILCDINVKNPCIKTGTLNIKQLRTKFIEIFEHDFKLEQIGLSKYEHVLPGRESDTYDLVLKIVTGYVYNVRYIENTPIEEKELIAKITNQLRDSVDYIIRKKFLLENKIEPSNHDGVWFIWSVMLGLFQEQELKILFYIFQNEYNNKKKVRRTGLLYGAFLIIIFHKKRGISRHWNNHEMNIIKKIQEISMKLYRDIKKELLNTDDTIVVEKPLIASRNGLDYISNLRPEIVNIPLDNMRIGSNISEQGIEKRVIRCKRFS